MFRFTNEARQNIKNLAQVTQVNLNSVNTQIEDMVVILLGLPLLPKDMGKHMYVNMW